LRLLAERGLTRVMVEAGPILSAAFVSADLVDEAVLLRGESKIGDGGLAALEALPLTALTANPALRCVEEGELGPDRFERYERVS
ncbi:MAG: diaminohydroxyphosphoribosylaminopyrimidine deaminase, partial [Variibacter sp.]|nr:diaminohydroxyphosphoribosylaminopyrimidine deaminase [Variibacter sp.]